MTRRIMHHGTTLIEMIAAIAVLGVIAGASLPVVHGATEAYAGAAAARRTSEQAAFALERIIRLLRDAPNDGGAAGALTLREARPDAVVFDDGRGVRLQERSLIWVETDGAESTLCEDVDRFEVSYVADDGLTDVGSDPSRTHRFHLVLTVGGFELRTCVLARARVTP